jgi:MarR family 2-MHQ and catechol resistance regulon transcriptional repressor
MKKCRDENGADQRRAYYWGRVRNYCEKRHLNWPSTELILNLAYAHDVLVSDSLRVNSRWNLSLSAMNILMILNLGGSEGYKQQELGSLLLVSRANVTKVIDGMEKRGLVTRSASKEDRRARFIKLTEAGKALVTRIIPVHNEKNIRFAAGLCKKEINILNKLLAKLSAKIIESGKVK